MRCFFTLFIILNTLSLVASQTLPSTVGTNEIKIGQILSTKHLASKKVKFFLDGEKAKFVNLSRTQVMNLDFCCGVNHEIQRINVKFFDRELMDEDINFSKLKEFTTNSGISLGMKQNILLSKLGKPIRLQQEKSDTIVMYVTEQSESKFLQEFDMPLYYEKFIFSDGFLKEYEFGFEYP
ncbi:hypothetical protein [Haemophilus pittmaniae]|uniref:hypothetical protein n=1 Tax=Haemophilus pittmaniae TaxID=249188 RepID=UPI0028DAFFE2|nr:hypothetical protein [Haemophilus pittmaniae]